MITVRKIKLVPEDKDFYSFFKNEQREQNKGLNIGIGIIHASSVLKSIDSGAEQKLKKSIENLNKKINKHKATLEDATKKITEKKKTETEKAIKTLQSILEGEVENYKKSEGFRKGLDVLFNDTYLNSSNLYQALDSMLSIGYKYTLSLISQRLKQDYSNDFVGIMTGQQSLRNYKNDNPLMFSSKNLNLKEDEEGFFFDVMLGHRLRVVLGRRNNENVNELKATLRKLIEKEYKLCNSTMQLEGKSLILNLCIDIPTKENTYVPIKDRTLGVDLGLAIPVYMVVNDTPYRKKSLGNINNFLRVRQQMQERRRRLQKDLTLTKGGKGRDKKMQTLEKLRENERNFCTTYNHKLSKEIVNFARGNKCEYINMENLTKDSLPDTVLRNWSFYQLRTMVEYKAKRLGIKVRLVNPAYTSQCCSECGHIDKENRPKGEKGQSYFKCTRCGVEKNADENGALNISRLLEGESLLEKLEIC